MENDVKLREWLEEIITSEKEELAECKEIPNGHNSFSAGMSEGMILMAQRTLEILNGKDPSEAF